MLDLLDASALAARRPIRIAHRGGVIGPRAPESSLAAIDGAARRGYDMVELDVVASRDGEPVVFHDYGGHLGRTCGVDARVGELSFDELGKIIYRASDQPIASLDASLARCAALGLGVMLDLRISPVPGWLERIRALLDRHGFPPGSVLVPGREPTIQTAFAGRVLAPIDDELLGEVRAGAGPDLRGRFWFGLPEELSDDAVPALHHRGALVLPAINTFRYPEHAHRELAEQDITRLLAAGVDGFQIDSRYDELLPPRP